MRGPVRFLTYTIFLKIAWYFLGFRKKKYFFSNLKRMDQVRVRLNEILVMKNI